MPRSCHWFLTFFMATAVVGSLRLVTSAFLRHSLPASSTPHRGSRLPLPTRRHRILAMSTAASRPDLISSEEEPSPDQKQQQHQPPSQSPPKVHTVTVCMVPPPTNVEAWSVLSEMRLELRDPGYYRWPPHVNLLYPFLKLEDSERMKRDDDHNTSDSALLSVIVKQLESATRRLAPFHVCMDKFGTFGGKRRGVLWLNPSSQRIEEVESDQDDPTSTLSTSPLHNLQHFLEVAFPTCLDQSQKGDSEKFVPHMTLSHFESLQDAQEAQASLEESFWSSFQTKTTGDVPLSFVVDRIYLLERKGDGGQFRRVAEIALGDEENATATTQIFAPPKAFPGMPVVEEDWVYKERMNLKKRRNGGGNQRRRSSQKRSGPPRVPDTPEVIAAKRAERKAKRERVLMQANQDNTGINDNHSKY